MILKIKNAKLTLLAVLFITILTSLGVWQLLRAQQKERLLKSFAERTTRTPLLAKELLLPADRRFYPAQLTGSFDNAHTLLLDNKTYQGKIGYEVYTPFIARGLITPILVDRGFIPIGMSRQKLPFIQAIYGNITISGMLNYPPRYFALGQITDASSLVWPLRIEFINLAELAKLLGYRIYPYTLHLIPHHPAAYAIEWKIVAVPPERHRGYAIQWFALALTLLILSITLNINKGESSP